MIAFTPTGKVMSFTADTSAPTPVQVLPKDGAADQQYILTNTDSSDDVCVGYGPTAAIATFNATEANTPQSGGVYFLLRSTQVAITAGPGAFFTGVSSSTAIVKVQPGYGN